MLIFVKNQDQEEKKPRRTQQEFYDDFHDDDFHDDEVYDDDENFVDKIRNSNLREFKVGGENNQ